MKKHTTIRDVARQAGVAVMTASKALGNKPGVSDEMRKHVQKVARQMNYVPNTLATSFRTNQTQSIGIVMDSSFSDIFPPLFAGIEKAAVDCGLSTLLANHKDSGAKKFEDTVSLLARNLVDGLVITSATSLDMPRIDFLESLNLPYVLAMCSHPGLNTASVRNNDHGGAYAMMRYLLRKNCRKFLLLPPDERFSGGLERLRGWLDALQAHGVPASEQNVVPVPSRIEAGFEAMKRLLTRGLRWDAAVCGSDHIAIGVLEALGERGVAVPEEIRVSGYDGIPLSEHIKTPLTTIQQPLAEIGQAGVHLLHKLIQDRSAARQHIVINGDLTARESA